MFNCILRSLEAPICDSRPVEAAFGSACTGSRGPEIPQL
jgi:hypothetical protein